MSVQVPDGAFSDPDGDPLSYSAKLADGSMLPTWLQFNSETRQFTGTPDDAQVGTLSIMVTAADADASVSQTFDLTVTNVNDAPSGAVSVVGTSAEDQTMMADTSSVADADGLGAMSYQWARSSDGGATWSDISGATGASYTLGDNDVGSQVHVNVSYTDGHGTAESLTSAASDVVANVNDCADGAPSLSSTSGHEDQTLHCQHRQRVRRTPTGSGPSAYQWARSTDGGATWSNITGATLPATRWATATSAADARERDGYTDGHGTAESLTQRGERSGCQRQRCAHRCGERHGHGHRRSDPDSQHQRDRGCRRAGRLQLPVGALDRRRTTWSNIAVQPVRATRWATTTWAAGCA